VVVGVDAHVRLVEKNIDAIETHTVDFSGGRQVEHGFQVDIWFSTGTTFTNQTGPHRIMEFRILRLRSNPGHDVLPFVFTNGSASGLRGPKCFSRTSGSVSLRF